MIPNHPFIHLTTHPSIHPRITQIRWKFVYPEASKHRNFLCSHFGKKYVILLSKLKKICWRSRRLGKKCALLGIWECWLVRDSHPCDLPSVVSKVTKAGLCNFPYPIPTFLNPIYTSNLAQIPLHPQSLPWFSSPVRHEWTWTPTRMSLWHLRWHSALLWLILQFQKALQHIHFTLYLPCWSPWSSELHPLHLHDVFRTKPSAWHTDNHERLADWNGWRWPWMGEAIQKALTCKHLALEDAHSWCKIHIKSFRLSPPPNNKDQKRGTMHPLSPRFLKACVPRFTTCWGGGFWHSPGWTRQAKTTSEHILVSIVRKWELELKVRQGFKISYYIHLPYRGGLGRLNGSIQVTGQEGLCRRIFPVPSPTCKWSL